MATVKLLLVFVTCLLLHGLAGAQAPRGNPARGGENPRGFPRAGRHPQAIQSLEFNGITVLHEDLLHSMSPVQEKLDITSSGISVTVRFQFDETMMHPNGKPQNRGSLSIVHNQTEMEVLRMPLYYDSGSRTQLRGDIRMSQEARRTLKKKCPDTTCVVHVSVNNRGFGRSTVIELGKLKVYKKSSGKTTFKLLTYPHFVEGINKGSSWESFGFTWSAAFHFFLVIGAGLMLLIGIEAWRVHGMISRSDDGLKVSKRWLQVAFVCSLLYLGMSGSRALDFVSMGAIVIAAPAAAVVGIFAFCFAGGPIEEDEYIGETPDEDYMGEDEDDTQSEETEETKKTI